MPPAKRYARHKSEQDGKRHQTRRGGGCGTIAAPQPPVTRARHLLPYSPVSMAFRIKGIPALWARRPLCSRADGVAFGAQRRVRGAGGCL